MSLLKNNDSSTIGLPIIGGTPGSVLFVDASSNLGQDNANLFYDDANNRLGLGINTPSYKLHVYQDINGALQYVQHNPNAGSAAYSNFQVSSDVNNSYLQSFSSTYSQPNTSNFAGGTSVSGGTSTGGLSLASAGDLRFYTGGYSNTNLAATISKTNKYIGMGITTPDAQIHMVRVTGSIGPYLGSDFSEGFENATPTNYYSGDVITIRVYTRYHENGQYFYSSDYAECSPVTIFAANASIDWDWNVAVQGTPESYLLVRDYNGSGFVNSVNVGNVLNVYDDNGAGALTWDSSVPDVSTQTAPTGPSVRLNYNDGVTDFGIYTAKGYFSTNVGINDTTPTYLLDITAVDVATPALRVIRDGSTSLNPAALIVQNTSGSANAGVTVENGGPNDIGCLRMTGTRVSTGDYLGVFEFQDLSAAGDYRTSMIFGKAGTALGYGGMEFLTRNAGGLHYALALSEHGRVGINMLASAPTAWLHLPAGSTEAGTAPIKFTSGALNTAPEIGAFEFLTDKLHFTITTGTSRKEIAINDIALTSGRVPIVTTNGRLTDLSTMTYASSRLSPSYITLTGGGTGAGTAPIKFTNGSLNSSPEAHALELNNDNIYYTILTGPSRKRFVLDDTTLVSGRVPYVTTNGRLTDSSAFLYATGTGLTITDQNIVFGTTTGTKIGTATTQRLSFYNSTPITQPNATTEIGTVLSNLGLRAVGTAYPITTSGSVTLGSLTSGRIPIAGTAGLLGDDADLTFSVDTLTATKFSGAHNGTVGATTPSSGVFTSLQTDTITNDTGLAAGVYTPVRSAEANMTGNATTTEAQYMRVGNTVTVSGRFTATPTLTATATSFEITLPVASNIGAVEDAAGVAFCGTIAGMGAEIIGVVANDTAKIQWLASDITSKTWSYTFSYQVL